MPELPEVETIRCELEPLISGKVFAAPILHMPTTIAYPGPERFAVQLSGRMVSGVGRKGKYLLINLDRGILVVHLRMTGNLIYIDEKDLPQSDRFLRVELPFIDGSALYYSDMRRFGRLWLVECEEQLQEIVLKNIGPDIYKDLNSISFSDLLQKRGKRGLKALLLDQGFASGMGNIYTDECLHRCGFHPERRASTLNEAEVAELYRVIIDVLDAGIKHGGTTFRDYRNARGTLGDFQSKLAVYGRKGESCKCGTPIEKTVVAGRGTYYCPRCQAEECKPEGKIKRMKIIGLTGGIASGKSTVAKMLEAKGAHLLDADKLAREAVEPGQPAWQQIVDWLGEAILLPDKNIDRLKLANLVFNDRCMLEKLNKIVHPYVGDRFLTLADQIRQIDPGAIIIYDIPLLIEAGMNKMVDLVLLVYVPRETQIARLQQRDRISRSDAELRLKAQTPLEEKRKHADYTIDNSGSLTDTAGQVDQIWQKIIDKI